jgi:hypothetical protein
VRKFLIGLAEDCPDPTDWTNWGWFASIALLICCIWGLS